MVRYILLSIAVLVTLSAGAQLATRVNYVELRQPQPTTDSSRIVVTEFFSYQCPHCYSLDPVLEEWVGNLPEDVLFERVPISLGYPQWSPIAQTFYALQAMKNLEPLHADIFRAIHIDGEQFYDKASIVDWLEGTGIDTDEFSEMYDSFSIATATRGGEQRSMSHRVDSVPSLAIDGRYRVAIGDNGTVENFEAQLTGVSELIDAIRSEKEF